MTTSENIAEIAAALAKAQGEMGGAVKDSDNPFFRSKYADLASVWDACRVPLAKNGLAIVQFPKTEYVGAPESYEWTSKQGEKRYGVRVVCVVSVLTRLTHASGQWMEDAVSTMLPTGDPQAVGSAISYLRRYALQSVAGVAPEDDDGEAAHRTGNSHARQELPTIQRQALTPMPPHGYVEWLAQLWKGADKGTPNLESQWKASKREYREYLTTTAPSQWEDLKKRAATMTSEIPA